MSVLGNQTVNAKAEGVRGRCHALKTQETLHGACSASPESLPEPSRPTESCFIAPLRFLHLLKVSDPKPPGSLLPLGACWNQWLSPFLRMVKATVLMQGTQESSYT